MTSITKLDYNEASQGIVGIGSTNYISPINTLTPPLSASGNEAIPLIVYYQGDNLTLKWARTMNLTNYKFKLVTFNPSGTYIGTLAF